MVQALFHLAGIIYTLPPEVKHEWMVFLKIFISAFRQLSEAKQKTTRYAGGEQKVKQKITFQVQ